MITAHIEITDSNDWDRGTIRGRVIKKDVPAITVETCKELIAYAHEQMKEGEELYQICAKRPHVKDEKLPQPFYDYFNGWSMVEWWNS